MTPTREGAFRLFRAARINVFIHWSWFIVAIYFIQQRRGASPLIWAVADYLALFCIVLMHEFGHALACRQVGGFAGDIILWPLGGVAYVDPPHRPGAYLWSIAAGPLVNVVLVPVLYLAHRWANAQHLFYKSPELYLLIESVGMINLVILIFNILPIYPLDGGKILHALLWYRLGYKKALLVATSVGFVGCAGIALLAVYFKSPYIGVMAFFAFSQCRMAWLHARSRDF